MKNTMRTVASFLIGGAVGAVTGMLVAPQSGKKTRKEIGKNVDQARKDLNKQYADIKKDLESEVQEKTKELNKLKKKVKDQVNGVV